MTTQAKTTWQEDKIGNLLLKSKRQKKVKRSEYLDSGLYPIIDQGDNPVGGYTNDESYLFDGDLPMTIFGDHTRRFKYIDFPFTIGADGTQLLAPKKEMDCRFFYYALKNAPLKNYGYQRHFKYLKDTKISFPTEKKTQEEIAHVLGSYDDLIENNTKRIKILEEIAQAIYREWFNKERGEITKLENCFLIYRGKSYRSEELSDSEGVPFVNLKCLDRDGGFRKSGLKRFIGIYKESQKVAAGDIVVAVTDMTQDRRIVAHAARIPTLKGGFGVISMDLVKLQPKENYDPDYLYCLLRWSGFSDEVKNHANGANVLHLNPARITDYKTFVTSPEKQKEFGDKVRPIFDLIDRLELQNESLRPARDLLLPKLVTGEVEVKI